jgi:hypothetical protein
MVMTTTMWTCEACEGTGHRLIDQAQTEAHPRMADGPRCQQCRGTGKVPHLSIRATYSAGNPWTRR